LKEKTDPKQSRTFHGLVLLWLLLGALLSGCAHWTDAVPLPGQERTLEVYGSHTAGQTLVCYHAGLDGISVQVLSYGARSLWLLFLSALLYLLPGGAIVAWLLPKGDWVERSILATGLSVAVNALLLYATMAGLRLNSAIVIGYLALCALLIAARWVRDGQGLGSLFTRVRMQWVSLRRDPFYLALGVVVLFVFGVRIGILRDVQAPRWGDSYQHTVIVQLLLDHGGIFESWAPYAPYTGLTTHFGFHANAALFHWTSGIGSAQSVMWTGQMLNAMACLVLYPLGKRIGGRWSGLLAVMVSGLLTTTPMIYVNWGRYPQLTGQVLLPIAAWLLWQTLDRSKLDWRLILLAALPAAEQVLAYYRMAYYYAVLVGALILCVYLPKFGRQWRRWGGLLFRVCSIGIVAGLILMPWGVRIVRGRLATSLVQGISYGRNLDHVLIEYRQWLTLDDYVSRPLLVLAGVALLWALLRQVRPVIAIGLWGIGMFALVATRLIGLPGAAHLNAFASMIFMYGPVSLLIGWEGAQAAFHVSRHWNKRGHLMFAVAVVLLASWGAYKTLAISDPGYDLVKPADWDAMAWIRANTPEDARFLVNGFSIYEGRSVVGSDAGWWIPLLAGRKNTMPPQYALLNETETEPGYGQRMVDLVNGLRRTPLSTPEGLRLVCDEGITHVYVGQAEGRVGVPPPEPLFTAQEMLSSPAFEEVYHRDRARVFALTDMACRPR
jgi:hypothetical protein